jgi:hypothetical protein
MEAPRRLSYGLLIAAIASAKIALQASICDG